MSIVHITTNSNYNVTTSYIKFINENFNIKEHKIVIIDNNKENIPKILLTYPNVEVIKKEHSCNE
jgi:hypothetical protein